MGVCDIFTALMSSLQSQLTALYWVLFIFFLLITGAFGYTLYTTSALWHRLADLARWKDLDRKE